MYYVNSPAIEQNEEVETGNNPASHPKGVSKILDKGVYRYVYNQRERDNVVLKVTEDFKDHCCIIIITIV